MYCKYCGAEQPDGAQFCGNCGRQLNHLEESNTAERITTTETIERPAVYLPRFPVAAIFLVLHSLLMAFNTLYDAQGNFIGVRDLVFRGLWPIYFIHFVLAVITAILMLKKSRKVLKVSLILYCVCSMVACVYHLAAYTRLNLTQYLFHGMEVQMFIRSLTSDPAISLIPVAAIIAYAVLIPLALKLPAKENQPLASIQKFWVVPGILCALELIRLYMFPELYFPARAYALTTCLAVETFLLGWWLTHPYKKQP